MSLLPRTLDSDSGASQSSANEKDLIEIERTALREILRLVSMRASTESAIEKTFVSQDSAADQEYERAKISLADKTEQVKSADLEAYERKRTAIVNAAIAGEKDAKADFARESRKIAADFDGVREVSHNDYTRAKADAIASFSLAEKKAAAQYLEEKRPIDDANTLRVTMFNRLQICFENYKKFGLTDPPASPTRESYSQEDSFNQLLDRLVSAEKPLVLLEVLLIPRAMKGKRFLWIFMIVFAVLVYPALQFQGEIYGITLAFFITVLIGVFLRLWLYNLSRLQVSKLYYPIHQSLIDAEAIGTHYLKTLEEKLKSERARVAARRDEELKQAKLRRSKTIAKGENTRDERLRSINTVFAQNARDIQTKQYIELRNAEEEYERSKAELIAKQASRSTKLEEKYQAVKEKIKLHRDTNWKRLEAEWREGMTRAHTQLQKVTGEVSALGIDWEDPTWPQRAFAHDIPPVIRFGQVHVDLRELPQGISAYPRLLDSVATDYSFPAIMQFPDKSNLLIETPREGRNVAIELLQAVMFRLIATLPPGQVRFTMIDPVGIGRNFGAFLHLADFDESLVTSQVWTDPRQIEERLTDLALHMEKVTQKYLRNEFATIGDYNSTAGEVAEPYRVLVIADFPANFDDKALSRLKGIITDGHACGVVTLIAVDSERVTTSGFDLESARKSGISLKWILGRMTWSDSEFGQFPLKLDRAPRNEVATPFLQRIGAASKDARRVEVPFEFIAPPAGEFWARDGRAGIDIALGKAGAVKRQHLLLGRGTSQHVLIAGRTGSGKSTLLHALITNLALTYSPDEIDLYLIDFKKGVEFKVYATNELPHATVVAIESEREFGISVLQRLDQEMRARADRFREAGVQDLNGFRNVQNNLPMPRILLIVDEFQEFFVDDDKVSQEAALLLDRLVRQGRAFGIHVLLGSQTLGGAYVLARSTLGQMAVRIALQCSEADAHLILSEQNPAARLLSRPGEAIYNDANGLTEGNHFFQVVWLPDERREFYLKTIRELASERPPVLKRTPIVFEGDASANLARNPLLKSLLEASSWPETPRAAPAWLGDAVAIKDPTAAVFRRQGMNHLLIVGQNAEAALGILASALISLGADYPPATSDDIRFGARFAIIDATPEDETHAEVLARVAEHIPHPMEIGNSNNAARIVLNVAEEVKKRRQSGTADGPEVFLLINDLPRCRDLRRREDDFGLSRRDEDASPSDNLATILSEGPGLGIHVLTWCDNLNNLNRVFSHQMLREFGMRVLFQMSPNDSGHLLDSPSASKLGPNRALYFSEEQNRLEKFRPYGLPTDCWLTSYRETLSARMSK